MEKPLHRTLGLAGLVIAVIFTACHSERTTTNGNDGYLTGAEGSELYYRVKGSGQDSIVMIHGGPGAGMNSFPSVEPLTDAFTLIFYDQRGGGRSELPADTSKLRPRYFVEDLEAVRSHFGLEKMNVITHSFGSILLAEYATKYPNRLKRVVLHGATGPRRSEMIKYYQTKAGLTLPARNSLLAGRASYLLQTLLDGTAQDPVATCREFEKVSRELAVMRGEQTNYEGTTCDASPEAVRYYYQYTAQLAPHYFGDWNYSGQLDSLDAPMLVVYGRQDSLAIPSQREWARSVPNGRLLLVSDAGKGPFSDKPTAVFPAIETFFSGGWPDDAIR